MLRRTSADVPLSESGTATMPSFMTARYDATQKKEFGPSIAIRDPGAKCNADTEPATVAAAARSSAYV
jgi:hypothetical protein